MIDSTCVHLETTQGFCKYLPYLPYLIPDTWYLSEYSGYLVGSWGSYGTPHQVLCTAHTLFSWVLGRQIQTQYSSRITISWVFWLALGTGIFNAEIHYIGAKMAEKYDGRNWALLSLANYCRCRKGHLKITKWHIMGILTHNWHTRQITGKTVEWLVLVRPREPSHMSSGYQVWIKSLPTGNNWGIWWRVQFG